MRIARCIVTLMLVLSCCCLWGETKEQKLTVMGNLSRAMAIGGESTGWTIDLDSETTIDGKPAHSIEIAYPDKTKLDKLANQHVRAKGKIAHRHGVETGDRTILEVSSIKALKSH